ncbi:MAG: DNA polymerase III subunit chi [Woeseiaceae bacterium]|nr:DNA polymerase III subunit chi [Woeseiaceae bacterium]
MARVDFYVLSQSGEQARQLFACRLAEKAYKLKHSVHIEAGSPDVAERLDDLLWTFRDGSFVPHHVVGKAELDSPVTIGCGNDVGARDLLINLSDDIPSIAASFSRIAELVSSDDDVRRRGRQRFATYRDGGHEIETHNV